MIAVDLHLHTCHSYDCETPLADVVRRCREVGLDCVAVTDHNTIEGAVRLRDQGMLRVIVGEEISTIDGELIGLFLTEEVSLGLTPLETIARVRAQGGLVCMPHPLGRKPFPAGTTMGVRQNGRFIPAPALLKANRLLSESVLGAIDLIEVLNARSPFDSTWAGVRQLAGLCGLPTTVGSDAHTSGEIGNARLTMPDFRDATDFLEALREGKPSGRKAPATVHLASTYAKLRKRLCSD